LNKIKKTEEENKKIIDELKIQNKQLEDQLMKTKNEAQSAEEKLSLCLSSIQNRAKLVLYCSQLLLKETDLGVKMYCAIIIRKVFLPNEKANPDGVFKEIPTQEKEILKMIYHY